MKINKEIIEAMRPCSNRFENYLKYYQDFDSTLEKFLNLENITFNDKMWVTMRLLSHKQLVEISCRIAESVLYIYENKYPNDDRPRKAIAAARAGNADATRAAAAAAAYAADAAAYAAYAAVYAAYAAVYAAYAADENKINQEKLTYKIILEVLNENT
jgi:hypothetical protein